MPPLIKRNKFDIVINGISLLFLFGTLAYLAICWDAIPNQTPAHYNAMGEIDRWANKTELVILPIFAWVLYIGITILEHYPQLWNTGVVVTKETKTQVYRILKSMIGLIKLLITGVFSYLSITSSFAVKLPVLFLPVFLMLLFGSILFFLIKLKNVNK